MYVPVIKWVDRHGVPSVAVLCALQFLIFTVLFGVERGLLWLLLVLGNVC